MEKLHILNGKEVKNINSVMEQQFGCSLPEGHAYLMRENGKLYMVTKDFAKIDDQNVRIDNIGLYIATIDDGRARLSIEGSQILGKNAKKNVVDIYDNELEAWIKGEDLKCALPVQGPVIIKHKGDFYGCGIVKNGVIINHIPKERRIK